MTARLTAAMQVSALLRRVHDAGGSAMVLARGDQNAGAILLILYEKGRNPQLRERMAGPDGRSVLVPAGPAAPEDESAVTAYWQRRRSRDSDLWVVELDIAAAERFAADVLCID